MAKCLVCKHRRKIKGLFQGASLCDIDQRIMAFEDAKTDYPCMNFESFEAMKDLVEALRMELIT